MNTFQIRDLMVSLNSPAHAITQTLCFNHTNICQWGCSFHHTPIFCQFGCTFNLTPVCHLACSRIPSVHCGFTPVIDWHTTTPVQREIEQYQEAELKEFKTNLAELQKYVDQKLQRTPAELDELENKLSEAINEVRAQKANAGKQQ